MTTLTNPHDLLAAVPFMIGYHPQDSLVIVAIRSNAIGVAMRIDFPMKVAPELVDILIKHLHHEGADSALVSGYTSVDDPSAELTQQEVIDRITESGVAVREALLIHNDRWRSTLCHDRQCCPLEGNPLPNPADSLVTIERVIEGRALPYSNLEELKSALHSKEINLDLVQAIARVTKIDYTSPDHHALQTAGALALKDLLEEFSHKGINSDLALVAHVLVRLGDLHIRDYGLGIATDENRDLLLSMWRWLTSIAPHPLAAAPATLYAELLYEVGDGALAMRALERAFEDDPEYSLAKLLRRAFAAGWPPSRFIEMRSELHPKICDSLFSEVKEG